MIFIKGLILGFSVAAPVGPIGLLCIQRTLNKGRLAGLLSGLGAATADTLYSCIAAFGFTVISQLLIREQRWLHLVGGFFLLYLGIKTFRASPSNQAAQLNGNGLFSMYLSTLFLTITNPMTILTFVGMFAGLGFVGGGTSSVWSSFMLVLSVFVGSAFWWFLLSGGVSLFKHWFDTGRLRWVNIIAGMLMAGLGVFSLVSM
ncbi:LysE family translocator [Alicyclobacillus fastidiosus]|uniref:LysE family translocator n=1 Tax=Alicyclobacillus fastidiosus TaxID=392011 RepID=A0ABY6ZQS2_9BACL|nr:LysE family transporter [Alicyclobacillus fastidiosus]WAH44444.1 LysE family translocator [Alicyclobacillus fastidiosus]GMA60788.1 lysine transporter LysE [Alicyclobacillus fastidiosus]